MPRTSAVFAKENGFFFCARLLKLSRRQSLFGNSSRLCCFVDVGSNHFGSVLLSENSTTVEIPEQRNSHAGRISIPSVYLEVPLRRQIFAKSKICQWRIMSRDWRIARRHGAVRLLVRFASSAARDIRSAIGGRSSSRLSVTVKRLDRGAVARPALPVRRRYARSDRRD